MKTQVPMSPRHKVLVVDDQTDIRAFLEISLGRMNLHTQGARSLGEARQWLLCGDFDLCLSAMRLPDGDAHELLQHIQQHHPQVHVAMIGTCDTPAMVSKPLRPGPAIFYANRWITLNCANCSAVPYTPREKAPTTTATAHYSGIRRRCAPCAGTSKSWPTARHRSTSVVNLAVARSW